MSWGRIDDGFTNHPKILALGSSGRRWTWLEVLTYSWRYRSPLIPDTITSAVRGATPKYLAECEELGLIDRDEQGRMQIHDWPIYSGETIGYKVDYYLTRNPEASANEVARAIGGTREIVLAEVARFKRHSQNTGTAEPDSEPVSEPVSPVRPNRATGTKSGSRARAPVPSPTQEEPKALGTSEVLLEAGSSAVAAIHEMIGMPDRGDGDPVTRLAAILPDRDDQTETVLRSFRLPEAAYEWARQEVLERGGGAGYAVQVLKRIQDEGTIASPTSADELSPDRANVSSTLTPEQDIRKRIDNGSLWNPQDLEAELAAAGINGDTATQLRALVTANGTGAADDDGLWATRIDNEPPGEDE